MRQRNHTVSVATLIVLLSVAVVVTAYGTVEYVRKVLTSVTAGPAPAERAWLQQRYGNSRNSYDIEEWIIRDALQDRRNGVFVDIGAADAVENSNTYYLEHNLGWSGLAVDAQEMYRDSYKRHRPRTIFETFFVSDASDEVAKLYTSSVPLIASDDRQYTARWGETTEHTIPTIRLTDLLDKHRIAKVDLLSIDVELAEPKVLAGFDVSKFRPDLVCIEAHPEVRQNILDYFATRGYVIVGKYLRVDDDNLYFVPNGTRIVAFPPEVARAWSAGH